VRACFAFFLVACGGDDGQRTSASFGTTFPPTTGSTTDDETSDASGDESDEAEGSDSGSTSDGPTSSPSTDGSDTSPPAGMSCHYACTSTADCLAGGTDYGYTCQSEKCVIGCSVDDGCIAYFSGWLIESCTASDDCDIGPCVVYEGGMGCGISPEVGSCTDIGMVEGMRMTTEGDMQPVCVQPDAVCRDLGAGSECVVPCADFAECFMDQSGEVCTSDGECVYACVSAADCPAANFDNVTAACG
jgi:hypothetical protein